MKGPKKENSFLDKQIFKEWYFRKGLILIDIFLIIALIQYFIFDGSFNNMILWVADIFSIILAKN